MKPPSHIQPLRITFDWRQYFQDFCQAHGEPIDYKGRFLFPDGWTYSTDYRGPEWAPPTDPKALRFLQFVYWNRRRRIVEEELKERKELLFAIEEQQRRRSGQVQLTTFTRDESGKTTRVPVDGFIIGHRIELLESDLADCLAHLKELRHASKENPTQGEREVHGVLR